MQGLPQDFESFPIAPVLVEHNGHVIAEACIAKHGAVMTDADMPGFKSTECLANLHVKDATR
jgi:hypothetical protein